MKNKYLLVLIAMYFGIEIVAMAQTESQIIPTEKKQLTIVTEPSSLNKGFFRAGVIGYYVVADKYFDNEGKKNYFTESAWIRNWRMDLLLQYGVTDRLEFDVTLPYQNEALYYSQSAIAPGFDTDMDLGFNLRGNGLGDMGMSVRYQLIQEKTSFPSITGDIGITLPTGRKNPTEIVDEYDFKRPTGSGEASTNFSLLARKIMYPYSFKLFMNYTYYLGGAKLFSALDTEEISFKTGNRINFGGSVGILLNEWIALTNELNYFTYSADEIDGVLQLETDPGSGISYEGRLIFQIKQFRIGEAITVPLKAKNSGANPLYLMMLQYVF